MAHLFSVSVIIHTAVAKQRVNVHGLLFCCIRNQIGLCSGGHIFLQDEHAGLSELLLFQETCNVYSLCLRRRIQCCGKSQGVIVKSFTLGTMLVSGSSAAFLTLLDSVSRAYSMGLLSVVRPSFVRLSDFSCGSPFKTLLLPQITFESFQTFSEFFLLSGPHKNTVFGFLKF